MLETAALLNADGRWPEDVSIWRLDMPTPGDGRDGEKWVAACYACLDTVERGRADRYRVAGERVRYIITRAVLRHVLAAQIAASPSTSGSPSALPSASPSTSPSTSPSALRFASVRNGRPVLADYPGVSFNVSHAGDHALIAVSQRRVVGVDIEHIHPETDWKSLIGMVCSASQRDQLSSAEPIDEARAAILQRRRFFQCWTGKEAILKALGVGLTDHLRNIDFSVDRVGVQRPRWCSLVSPSEDPLADEVANLSFHWLTDIDGYMGCIAYSDAVAHVAA